MSTHSQSRPVCAITSVAKQCGIESQPPMAGLPSRHNFLTRFNRIDLSPVSLVSTVVRSDGARPGAVVTAPRAPAVRPLRAVVGILPASSRSGSAGAGARALRGTPRICAVGTDLVQKPGHERIHVGLVGAR